MRQGLGPVVEVVRAARRQRVLRWGVFTSILNRGMAALVPLLMVPTALRYLGATEYGAWATALALTAFVGFADLGIGTGLMTRLGALQGVADSGREARRLVASAYMLTSAIVLTGLLALWASTMWMDWSALVGAASSREVEVILLLTLSAVIVNIIASLIVRVQYGVGQQGQSNLWQTAGSVAALAFALVVARLDLGRGWFVAVAAFAPVLVAATNSALFFASPTGRRLRGRRSDIHLSTVQELLSLGSKYLVVSLLATASVAIDPWIVAQTTDLAHVPSYAIPLRIFTLIGTVSVMATAPLWPMNSQALEEGDTDWVRRTTWQMTALLTAIVAVLCLVVVLGRDVIVRLWLGNGIEASPLMWVGFGTWCFVQTLTGAAFMVQNGATVLKPQVVGYVAFLLTSLPLKWLVSTNAGPAWIPVVGSLLYVVFVLPACLVGYRTALRRAAHRSLDPELPS